MNIFGYLKISFASKSVVDQGLTQISQIDPKLDFDVFHILNYGRISKIKNVWWPRPPKKPFGGRSRASKLKDLGYVSDCLVFF